MNKNRRYSFFFLFLIFPALAFAVGLGNIKVHSFLNDPFQADVPILDLGNIPISLIQANLGSKEDYEELGLDRDEALGYLSFNVVQSEGRPIIRITSDERIKEPFLQILVDLVWATGQISRSYSILLDPPHYQLVPIQKFKRQSVVFKEESAALPKSTVSTPANANPAPVRTYGPVMAHETIWQIAQRYKTDDVTLQQMILAILEANQDAFTDGNLNALKQGVRLTIPPNSVAKAIPKESAKLEVYAHDKAWHSKQPIEHALNPPYTQAPSEPAKEVSPVVVEENTLPAQTDFETYTSSLVSIPTFNQSSMISYLPNVQSLFNNKQEVPLSKSEEKEQAELHVASVAIDSIRATNELLQHQLKIMQAHNQKLQQQLNEKDKAIKQLRNQMRLLVNRRGIAGQTSQSEGEAYYYLPYLLIILLFVIVGWFFYKRLHRHPVTIQPNDNMPSIGGEPMEDFPQIPNSEVIEVHETPPSALSEPIIETVEPPSTPIEPQDTANSIDESAPTLPEPEELPIEAEIKPHVVKEKEEDHMIEYVVEKSPVSQAEKSEVPPSPQEEVPLTVEEPNDNEDTKIETLFELVVTYQSMGDIETAKETLAEIQSHGNEEQKQRARELLKQLEK